ncbi:MAG TPA: transposase [Candidatus Acidoferrales bacterium]|nr:transposase [Candidatus Acidoferrales bacterium]
MIARGNRQQAIFRKQRDYKRFLDTLENAVTRFHFHLHAYVLMPNHFHLLAEQEEFPLSRFMQVLLTSYARWYNRRYRQIGHLFQSRYRAILCDKESYLLELSRYIHLNPVRANIVKRPEHYPWSSYSAYLRGASQTFVDRGAVLGTLARNEAAARRAYEIFVLDALDEGRKPELYATTEQVFLGGEEFIEKSKTRLQRSFAVQPAASAKPTVEKIVESVSIQMRLAVPVVIGRTEGEAETTARQLVAGIARHNFGLPLTEVARSLNRRPNTVSLLAKKFADLSQTNETMRELTDRIIKSII